MMNTPDHETASAQTINECLLRPPEPSLAHSKGKPDVSSPRNNINVRFATPLTVEFQIRVAENAAGWQRQAWLVPLLTLNVPHRCEHCLPLNEE
jgi:hypothetical protein